MQTIPQTSSAAAPGAGTWFATVSKVMLLMRKESLSPAIGDVSWKRKLSEAGYKTVKFSDGYAGLSPLAAVSGTLPVFPV
jgi:hypothetical protein